MQKLTGVVQNYAWGDPAFIADLINADKAEPQAEYWLGAHPRGAGTLSDGTSLDDVIAADPLSTLGAATHQRYGQLPYLLKILAAAKPLSIQCHPSKQQAEAGFAREDNAGIDLTSPVRTYRDDNHKPELICALTPFEAKVGFRSVAKTRELIDLLASPELNELSEILAQPTSESTIIRDALSYLLELPKEQAHELVVAVVAASERAQETDVDEYNSAIAWTAKIEAAFPGDIGVLVALLLNHVSLEPHQAIGLKAGNLHCYLSGAGVEIMANSDNVVRGGMTPKHIDVSELLSIVNSEPSLPEIDSPTSPVHVFTSPADEFSLTWFSEVESKFSVDGPEIWVVTSGRFEVTCGDSNVVLNPGDACFVSADDGELAVAGSGDGWRAQVGG